MSDSLSEESLCAFLDHLAETSNVSLSAKRAGVSRSAVYRLRASCPAFSHGWQMAIATGYDELEFRMLKTARFGTIKPVKRPDGSIGKATEFDDAQGLKLLMAYKQSAEKARAEQPPDRRCQREHGLGEGGQPVADHRKKLPLTEPIR